MAEQHENGGQYLKRKQIRQPPSVPFLWEEKPGIPKKNWKPATPTMSFRYDHHLPPPVKFVASIPFNWEEKPGKPLQHYSSPYNSQLCNTNNGVEAAKIFDFETDDSFSSASSVLPNCLMVQSASVISMEESIDDIWVQMAGETPSSPASEITESGSTSSYATGRSSLVGSSFLECLFPLFPPTSGFLQKVSFSDDIVPPNLQGKDGDDDDDENNKTSGEIRRPTTLGELIMVSRRRSCQRKAAHFRKLDLSMELMKKRGVGCCCMLTSSMIKVMEGLQWKKLQPRHKLV
ncbi:uncharacterized protein LOC110820372 [Carica papaya]|uniref:uncharacterized protein LOC110820372 n=1 Tax=Carica papaya TaxID=3649 RepID=UPI000B8D15EB|nr:uncharacterized protein LOC110820372 [Carica papaya]